MSLTSKQIDELRAYAADRKGELAKLITDAADTIEMLSAKVHAYKNPVDMFPDLTDEEKKASREYAQGYSDALKDASQWGMPDEAVYVLIRNINPAEICAQIEADNLRRWCEKMQELMKMALPEPYREEGNPCYECPYECPDYDKEEYICVSSGACVEVGEGEGSERKTGKWEKDTKTGRWRCSECCAFALKTDDGRENLSDYCPVCGAKIEEGE